MTDHICPVCQQLTVAGQRRIIGWHLDSMANIYCCRSCLSKLADWMAPEGTRCAVCLSGDVLEGNHATERHTAPQAIPSDAGQVVIDAKGVEWHQLQLT